MQLLIPLSRRDEPLYRQLYGGLRKAILEETLQKLPSTREIAEQLGGSRTAALMTYEQLLAEGFGIGRPSALLSEVGIPQL
jgi:GntR family transcriptional regulator/MocR family aminotransferase